MGVLALSRGDPSGIGLEIACKAWLSRQAPPFLLVADLAHCRRAATNLDLDVPFAPATSATAASLFADALPVLDLGVVTRGEPGRPDPVDVPGTLASLERCAELVAAGEASALVTLPVSKEILRQGGFPHPGQTEFMGELATRLFGVEAHPIMLLWSPVLAVAPVTIHAPLAAVPRLLTTELIVTTIRTLHADLLQRFGLAAPRIAVTGLNPHAGENGDMGREEIEVIAPALALLRGDGIAVSGPHPADTLFHAAARARYDVAVTMYHDQGLIPLKALAFDAGVNVTLGLPFIRTSPDHGTAFDIAGQGAADPASLIAALALAERLARATPLAT